MADHIVGRQIDGGRSTFRRGQEKRFQQPGDCLTKSCLPVNTHIGGNGTWMTAIYRDSPALQPYCQFSGKQNIGKFALRLGLDHIVPVAQVNIIEMNSPHFMCAGGNVYDSGAGRHHVKKQGRKEEMAQMIDPELSLYPVVRFLAITCFIICFCSFQAFYRGSGRWSGHPLWPDAHARAEPRNILQLLPDCDA